MSSDEMVRAEPCTSPAASPRRGRRGWVTVLLVLAALGFVGWAMLRLAGLEVNRYTTALIALTPYASAIGIVLALVTLLLRRWLTALVVAATAAVLVTLVVPRAIPDEPVPVNGFEVTVMTSNMYFGEADAERIVTLVRRHGVDVLSLQELTPRAVNDLEKAGLFEELPHRLLRTVPGADGSGIVSRYPLRPLSLMPRTTARQPSALIDLPGSRDMEFVAVHPVVPVAAGSTSKWKQELEALPAPTDDRGKPVRVLAGDFNATLDHTPMRQLLGQGYEDAGEVAGRGLVPTWPERGRPWAPPVTLDHVLVSGGTVVHDYRTFVVEGTDHRAVVAKLVVPSRAGGAAKSPG